MTRGIGIRTRGIEIKAIIRTRGIEMKVRTESHYFMSKIKVINQSQTLVISRAASNLQLPTVRNTVRRSIFETHRFNLRVRNASKKRFCEGIFYVFTNQNDEGFCRDRAFSNGCTPSNILGLYGSRY